MIRALRENIKSLENSPRELYINFILKFSESYNYFVISQILVIFLHDSFGFSDMQAGGIYGLWGTAITFWGLLTATCNDALGVKRSLLIGFSTSAVATTMIAFTTSSGFLQFLLFAFLPLGNSLGMPMLTVGIRRYTTTRNRGFAFGLFYSVMNIGAFVSGLVVDYFNIDFGDLHIFGRQLEPNRLIILTASLSSLSSFLITFFFLREIRVDENEGGSNEIDAAKSSVEEERIPHSSSSSRGGAREAEDSDEEVEIELTPQIVRNNRSRAADTEAGTVGPTVDRTNTHSHSESPSFKDTDPLTESTSSHSSQPKPAVTVSETPTVPISHSWAIIKELAASATFWRFVAFTLLLINLKAIFRHLDATLPTYLLRVFGSGVPKGLIYSINPFVIMFLTPVVSALTTHYAHYDMIKYGGYLTALSPFFLAVSTSIWATICMVIVLSLGEAVWSPRTYDYTMSIAPEGKEASFAALATAPLFLATVPVGLMSGFLVSTFLPEDGGPQQPRMLWLVVGLTTMISPVLITLLERWIREPAHTPASREAAEAEPPMITNGAAAYVRVDDSEPTECELGNVATQRVSSSHRPLHRVDSDRVPLVKKNGYTECAGTDSDV